MVTIFGEQSQVSPGLCHEHRRASAVSADIPHCESQLSVTRRQVVKVIAAGRRRWPRGTGDVEPFHLGRFLRKKVLLNFAGHSELLLGFPNGSLSLKTLGDVTRVNHNSGNRFILQSVLGGDIQHTFTAIHRIVTPLEHKFIMRLAKRLAKFNLESVAFRLSSQTKPIRID